MEEIWKWLLGIAMALVAFFANMSISRIKEDVEKLESEVDNLRTDQSTMAVTIGRMDQKLDDIRESLRAK